LARAQEEVKRQADKERKEVEKWKVGDRDMKDLVFKKKCYNLKLGSSYNLDKGLRKK